MAAKKRRDPHRTSTRPRGRIESIRPTGSLDDLTEHHLLEGVDQALRDPHPLALLTLALVDGCADALFDTEFRTAARRVLARVASGDPEIFRRRGKAQTAACAVCWIVAKANRSLDLYQGPGVQAKQLMAHFGLTGSSSQRAEPMLRALGVDWRYGHTSLGSADFLVSLKRDTTIGERDYYRAQQSSTE
jgi:hypothetical protein